MVKFIFTIFLSFSFVFAQSGSFQENFSSDDETAFDSFEDEYAVEQPHTSWDPLEVYNAPMTRFNDFIYMYIMGPIAKSYRYVFSKPIREGVSNAFHNVQFPIRFTNNLLQLKFNNAFEESARFAINSTYGLAGFIDIAKKEGKIERHNEDFGQTLGYYGMGNDIHIVLPLFGPSNLRDTIGLVADAFVDPFYYAQKRDWNIFKNNNVYIFLNTYKIGNEYSLHVDEYENIRKDSINLYLLLKTVYEQRRDKLIEE